MSLYYRFDPATKQCTPVESVNEIEFNSPHRLIARFDRHEALADTYVSTVFLGIDHNHQNTGKPILFETMVFLYGHEIAMQRYVTHEDALYGHQAMVDTFIEQILYTLRKLRSTRRIKRYLTRLDTAHFYWSGDTKAIRRLAPSLSRQLTKGNTL
jgi:hypothetical protein